MKSITISKIAELADVSKTTVSRVLNKKPDVSAKTRERIEEIIRQYNFSPNAFASAILKKKSDTIALVIPYEETYIMFNPYYSDVIRGVSNEIKKHGYYLMLIYTSTQDYLAAIRQKRIDGLIMLSPGTSHHDMIENILEHDIPFVSSSKLEGFDGVPSIVADDFNGAIYAVEHLVSLGHKRVGFINGPEILSSSKERLRGYKHVLKKAGIEYDASIVTNGDTSIESGYNIAKRYLDSPGLSAIFTGSDLMAIGAISAINEAGLSVPENISLVGFDDMLFSSYLNPPLTTVRQHAFEKGRLAARTLVGIIKGEPVEHKITMPVELIIRKSTTRKL